MKIPKLPRAVVTHYANLAKSEQVAIEIKVEGACFRITPFDAQAEAFASNSGRHSRFPEIDVDL